MIDWDELYKIMRKMHDPLERANLELWLYNNDPRKTGDAPPEFKKK